jgi:tetratricopeptide (TPR) repeat protein
METMVASGDVAAALAHARSYITRVKADLGIPVNPRVLERSEQLAQEAKKRGLVRLEPGPADSRSAARGTEAPPLGPACSARGRGRLPTLAAGVLVSLSAVWAIAASTGNPAPEGAASVVVLPFADVDLSPADAPLGEALAEDVAATLSIVPNLEVRDLPETSHSGQPDPRRVARVAGATYVVTGTVRRRGTRAEARTHLVHAATGDVRWEGTHTRELRSTEALVEALSMAVADDLRTRVAHYVPHHYTDSESAFEAFLTAVYWHRKFNEESIWVALQHYRRGWEEDPGFALAHAIAGTAYMSLSQNFGLTGRVGWEHGREHAMRALELDPTLPEAYSVLGRLQLWWERDFGDAEATLRRAIMLYPTHPDARTWYGYYQLYYLHDFEGAVASMRRSLQVDPLNTARSRDVETVLYHARRFEEVAAQRRHTESLDADVAAAVSNYRVADAYREMERYDEAIAEYRAVHGRRGGRTPVGLGVTYARTGQLAEARAVLREREAGFGPEGATDTGTAQLYANLGELDRAFEALEQVLENNSTLPLGFTTNPAFDPLRSDARFDEILRPMGLPVP